MERITKKERKKRNKKVKKKKIIQNKQMKTNNKKIRKNALVVSYSLGNQYGVSNSMDEIVCVSFLYFLAILVVAGSRNVENS